MNSIRRQLTTGLLAGFGLLLAGGGTALYGFVRAALLRELDGALHLKAAALLSATKQHQGKNYGRIDLEFRERATPGFTVLEPDTVFQCWRADGTELDRSESLGPAGLARPGPLGERPVFWDTPLPGGRPGRAAGLRFTPRAVGKAPPGEAQPQQQVELIVVVDAGEVARALGTLRLGLLLAGGGVLLGTVLLVNATLRRGLRPLDDMAAQAARIEVSTLDRPFAVAQLPAELRPIGARLNESLARLAEAFEHERRFSADVAHELRTPLAELRSLAEVALRWPEGEAARPAAWQDVRDAACQMEAIVNSLLAIARCESGRQPVRREPVRLRGLVEERWMPLAAKARARALALDCAVPDAAMVETDRALLGVVLANLLANAVDYAPERGVIRVTADTPGGRLHLRVQNAVTGLTAADVEKFFRRFWRKDAARTDGAHSGLGLSLARAAARTLDLELTARLETESRRTVSVATAPVTGEKEKAGDCSPAS